MFKSTQAFYELCAKWVSLPPFGTRFVYKTKHYEIVGIVQAGNKLRAKCDEDGKVYQFEARDFWKKYKAVKVNMPNSQSA